MSFPLWKTTPQAKIYQYLWSPAFLAMHLFNLINMIMSFAFPNQAKISTAFLSQVFFSGNENCLRKRMGNRFISITSHNRHCSSANHLLEMA